MPRAPGCPSRPRRRAAAPRRRSSRAGRSRAFSYPQILQFNECGSLISTFLPVDGNRLARSHSGMFLPGNRRQEADLEVKGFEVTGDQRVGEGGHLRLRRMRMRLVLSDGSRTGEARGGYVSRTTWSDCVVVTPVAPA